MQMAPASTRRSTLAAGIGSVSGVVWRLLLLQRCPEPVCSLLGDLDPGRCIPERRTLDMGSCCVFGTRPVVRGCDILCGQVSDVFATVWRRVSYEPGRPRLVVPSCSGGWYRPRLHLPPHWASGRDRSVRDGRSDRPPCRRCWPTRHQPSDPGPAAGGLCSWCGTARVVDVGALGHPDPKGRNVARARERHRILPGLRPGSA